MRRVLEMTLASDGHQVRSTASGDDALRLAHSEGAEVALIDAALDGPLDGYALAEALRSEKTPSSPSVIALTSANRPYEAKRGAEAGIVDDIAKPFDTQELLDKVAAIGRSRPAAQPKSKPAGESHAGAFGDRPFHQGPEAGRRTAPRIPSLDLSEQRATLEMSAKTNSEADRETVDGGGASPSSPPVSSLLSSATQAGALPTRKTPPSAGTGAAASQTPSGQMSGPPGDSSSSKGSLDFNLDFAWGGAGADVKGSEARADGPAGVGSAESSAKKTEQPGDGGFDFSITFDAAEGFTMPPTPEATHDVAAGVARATLHPQESSAESNTGPGPAQAADRRDTADPGTRPANGLGAAAGRLRSRLQELGFSDPNLTEIIGLCQDTVERVVWEVVPDLAEAMIREEIDRLTARAD